MRTFHELVFASLGLIISGCSAGQVGADSLPGVACVLEERAIVGLDEETPAGFRGADVVALGASTESRPLRWADGTSTQATIAVEQPGTTRYLTYAEGCPASMEVDATLRFSTANGAFDERWPTTLRAESASRADVGVMVHPEEINGSFVLSEVPPPMSAVSLYFEASFLEADGIVGRLWAEVSNQDAHEIVPVDVATF